MVSAAFCGQPLPPAGPHYTVHSVRSMIREFKERNSLGSCSQLPPPCAGSQAQLRGQR